MYKNILVPIDVSHEEVGARILRKAAALRDADGTITVVHVVPEIPGYVETYVPEEVRSSRTYDLRKALEDLASDAGVKVQVLLESGGPATRILELIDELDTDLVIVGSHRPNLSDYFLGSTAARVVRHAQCSVLVER